MANVAGVWVLDIAGHAIGGIGSNIAKAAGGAAFAIRIESVRQRFTPEAEAKPEACAAGISEAGLGSAKEEPLALMALE
jgi:hypothetical protein